MANISELTNLTAMAAYYERKVLTLPPYAGETYFPSTKIATDMLTYLNQKQGAPVLAQAAKYDAAAKPINRDEFAKETFATNFFRSASALNEQDLEEINRAMFNQDDQLVKSLIVSLFDDKTKLLLGMRSRREWMAFQALMTGKVELLSNGVESIVEYQTEPDFKSTVDTSWDDTQASNPIEDLRAAIKAMKRKGTTPNQVIMNDDTFTMIQHNEKVKATLYATNANTPQVILREDVVVDFIKSELHVIPVVYDQGFIDAEATGTTDFTPFIPAGKVVLLNGPVPAQFAKTGSSNSGLVQSSQVIGHMAFAPTPEELGVRNGKIASNAIQFFDTGVAYHEYFNDKLVETEDLVSMNVLPSFEGSRGVYRLTVLHDGSNQTGNGGKTETTVTTATGIKASQATLSQAIGAVKNVTVSVQPANATDAAAVLKAVTATSDHEEIATVTAGENGGFDIAGVADGVATVTFTSGSFTSTVAVTIHE